MKATHHYTKNEPLEIMDMKINARSCTHIKISFTIDARHILLALTCMTDEDIKKASRKSVEEQLRKELFYKGEAWYLSPIDYGEDGNHHNLRDTLKEVLPIGKKLFPEFFDTPNSVKFIKDLT